MNNKAGFAVIGAGLWGSLHARIYSESEKARLAAVCDTDPERAAKAASLYNADPYTNLRDMLARDDILAVSIVTPDFAHTAIALEVIAAGKHLLIEKPLATTSDDCRKIIDAAEKAGVKLMVDFHNRWSPPFYRAKSAIDSGEIGDVRLIYYRLNDTIFVPTKMLSWASKSTVQWFIGSHSLDTVTWLIGDEVKSVYSVSRSVVLEEKGITTPDFYETILEFKNGAIAVIENCWILPESLPNIIDLKCEMVGSKGALYVDGSSHRMLERYIESGGSYPDTLVSPEIHDRQMGFAAESIRHFIDCIVNDVRPAITGEDGLRVTRLIEAIEESTSSGNRIDLAQ